VSSQATVRLRFFAGYREVLGMGEITRPLAPGSTAQALWDALVSEHPDLAQWPPSVAVNGEWSAPDAVLADGDEVAFLPPIAGG